ncbi:aminotransferase class I/II-fold pyridoxal phosphate-dependent enzyme [Krasilnikoviella flava]|uniref:Aminotransferase n=1 Tax=Krasilnikoviella flava TaxID=526729 RepID=A0A1T5KF20_9MICO|nr:aminotransferase class I/II-fold pyridoxal phosphate-dependent enzyme [Krasilnikoviella flava]SKC61958.1 Aspartate/methionine/tyrosine aminotransferase [Krasilnikoviella flava]
MKVSRRSHVPPFAVMQVLATANERRAAGHDVLNLCAGEPSTGASDVVREKAAELLRTADLGYTESLGVPALRREIAGHYRRWYDVDVDPARIAVTTGSSGGFLLAFLAAFDVGDRVALARPGYPAYKNILAALGCEVVELDCGPDTRYQPTVSQLMEAYYAGGLDGLVVASPANPTGTMLPPAELAALARWCEEHDVRLISDEIYHGIAYSTDVQQATAAMYADSGAVVVNSFSKYWAMTGWRLGWLVLPDELVGPVDALAGNVALSPPALAQHAGVAAFSPAGYAAAAENVARYATSRAALLDRVDELGWRPVAPADGAFYLYGNVAGFRDAVGGDSVTYCRRLLAEADVAITPGADFDTVGGGDWVRLSFAAAPEVVSRAVDRIVAWHRTL